MAIQFPNNPNTDPGVGGIATLGIGNREFRWTGESWVGVGTATPIPTLQEVLDAGNTSTVGLSVVGVITATDFDSV